jgi:PBSX family phage terminase large subunit
MKRRTKKDIRPLRLEPFSLKHSKLLQWWNPEVSPYSNYSMIISDGSIRSGKSLATVYSFFLYTQSMFTNANNPTFAIVGQSVGSVRANIIDEIFIPLLESLGFNYNYNIADGLITVGNCKYKLYGAPNERAQNALQGKTLYGAIADEAALYPQSFFSQLIGRCSGLDDNNRPGKIFATSNPLSPRHYFKVEYIDKCKELNILYLHFLMDDNLSLSEDYKETQKRLQQGVFYKRNILGLWVNTDGLCYPMFDDCMIVNILPPMIEYHVGVDVGDNHATTFVLVGKSKDNKLYVIKEYKENNKIYSAYAKDFINFIDGYRIKSITIDSAAASFKRELENNNLRVKNVNKSLIPVSQGIGEIGNFLANGKLFIYKNCTKIIDEFFGYRWDEKSSERGEDKVIKLNDDLLDSLRYVMMENFINNPRKIVTSLQGLF